jgi:hypothetical protein
MKRAVSASALTFLWLAAIWNSNVSAAQPRLTSITLKRTGCMGSCPVYSLSLNDTGEATYTGYQFVPRIGVYKSHVDLPTFLDMIASDDPWSLEDAGPFASDTPSLTITMVAGNQTRVVHLERYWYMPRRFASIVAAMDGITAYSGWQPVSATALAGKYVWSDGVNALDELFVGADGAQMASFWSKPERNGLSTPSARARNSCFEERWSRASFTILSISASGFSKSLLF